MRVDELTQNNESTIVKYGEELAPLPPPHEWNGVTAYPVWYALENVLEGYRYVLLWYTSPEEAEQVANESTRRRAPFDEEHNERLRLEALMDECGEIYAEWKRLWGGREYNDPFMGTAYGLTAEELDLERGILAQLEEAFYAAWSRYQPRNVDKAWKILEPLSKRLEEVKAYHVSHKQ